MLKNLFPPFLLRWRISLASFSVTPAGATTRSSRFVITYQDGSQPKQVCEYLIPVYFWKSFILEVDISPLCSTQIFFFNLRTLLKFEY